MSVDPEDLFARARAAQDRSAILEGSAFEAKVQAMLARAEHALIEHTPVVEARLRLLLEDGEALRKP